MLVMTCFFVILYAYFFQGGGWNQNSQFDTIRAIVEQGTTEITAYAGNTGDIGQYQGRIYANKLPGLAFTGAPFYWVAYHLERLAGIDQNSLKTITLNAQFLTFILSGLPGVVLLLVLFAHLRRRGASVYEAFFLSSAFGMGSLLLPYSGVMMDHIFVACLLFAAWHIISTPGLGSQAAAAAGLLAGLAVLTDSLAGPGVAIFAVYLAARKRSALAAFIAGGTPMALAMLDYNYLCFGSIFASNHSVMTKQFTRPGYLFGVLTWPEPERFLWLTIHPFRGLFYCCPVFIISLFAARVPLQWRKLTWEDGTPLLTILYFLLFNMSFNGWIGGWSFGPRYLIPATPFLFSFSLAGYRRLPTASAWLTAISVVFMFSTSAVLVMVPAANSGPPPLAAPVLDSIRLLLSGHVSIGVQGMLDYVPTDALHGEWASYNVGELIGLPGLRSLLPLTIAFAVFAWFAYNLGSAGRKTRAR